MKCFLTMASMLFVSLLPMSGKANLTTQNTGSLQVHSHIKGEVSLDGLKQKNAFIGGKIKINNITEGFHELKIGESFSTTVFIDGKLSLDTLFVSTSRDSVLGHILIGKNKKALDLFKTSHKHRGFEGKEIKYTPLEKAIIAMGNPKDLAFEGLTKYQGTNKTVSLRLKGKKKNRYKIVEIADGRVKALKKVGKKYKTAMFSKSDLSDKDVYKLLPKTEVGYILKASLRRAKTESAIKNLEKVNLTSNGRSFVDIYKEVKKNGVTQPEGLNHKGYSTLHSKTPKVFIPMLQNYGRWLKKQQMDKVITKIFVKNVNGRKAVLYIQVNKKFFKPNKDTLNIYIEGLWRMWHSQLKNNGMIASNKMVHLVLLSEENIIVGGSRYEKSEDFWVAKK